MKVRMLLLTILLNAVVIPSARAQQVVIDPANLAQAVIQVARLIQSNINEAAMIANQIQSLENEFKNLAALDFNTISDFTGQMEALFETLGSIEGLMQHLAELETRFEEVYPDLSTAGFPIPSSIMAEDIHARLQRTRDMVRGALKTSARVLESMPNSQAQLAALMESSQASVGILQAAQAGNQISGEIAAQLLNLNGQLASYIQAHTAQLMAENGAALAAKNRTDHVMEDWYVPSNETAVNENPF